jgi:hypothetical protein
MIDFRKTATSRAGLAAGAAILFGLGAAGGATAVAATRPPAEMAPVVATPVAKLAASNGIVTAKGRVAEVYGDHFILQDASGRTMVTAGREGETLTAAGAPVTVQGRFADGMLRASYLVDAQGDVQAVGPRGPRPGPHGPGREGPGRDGPPPPPPGGPDAAPPPPPPPPAAAAGQQPCPPAPAGAPATPAR